MKWVSFAVAVVSGLLVAIQASAMQSPQQNTRKRLVDSGAWSGGRLNHGRRMSADAAKRASIKKKTQRRHKQHVNGRAARRAT